MNKAPGINIVVQFIIITCSVLSLVYSVPLYMYGTSAPAKVLQTGIGEVSQVYKAQKTQYTNFPFGRNNWFSNDGNSNQNGDFFYPAPLGMYEKTNPQQPSEINELTPENDHFSDTRIPIKDDHGLNDSERDPGSWSWPMETNQKTGSEQDSDSYTLSWSETGTDNTTETSEYETATNTVLNRNGASPAVVASLLG